MSAVCLPRVTHAVIRGKTLSDVMVTRQPHLETGVNSTEQPPLNMMVL